MSSNPVDFLLLLALLLIMLWLIHLLKMAYEQTILTLDKSSIDKDMLTDRLFERNEELLEQISLLKEENHKLSDLYEQLLQQRRPVGRPRLMRQTTELSIVPSGEPQTDGDSAS